MKPTATPPSTCTHRVSTWWLTALMCLAVGLGTLACTSEQEREDQQPTAEPQEAENVSVDDLANQPDVYAGRRVRAESTVQQVVSDRGLYLGESEDQRLFVTVLGPKEVMPDLEEQQQVRLTGQVAGRQRILQQVGNQLNEETRQELEQNRHAMVVGADEIEVVEQAPEPQVTEVDFSEVVSNPETYAAQRVRGETSVREVVGDRGAYLGESDDERLFMVIRQPEEETPEVDLKARQRVRVQGEVLSTDEAESDLDDQLSSEMRLRLREQGYVLVADPQSVEVLEEAPEVSVSIGDNDYGTLSDWDTDGNQQLSRDEFMTNVTEQNVMSDLSTDQDRTLGEDEFSSWMMSTLDRDNDDALSQREFRAVSNSLQEIQPDVFEDWNTDENQTLSASEFQNGLEQAGLFGDWDADGNGELGPDEFADGLFGVWDRDEDGNLGPQEIGFEQPQTTQQPEAMR